MNPHAFCAFSAHVLLVSTRICQSVPELLIFVLLLKFYSFGAFRSNGWQNLTNVFRSEFWMEVWEIVACLNIEPTWALKYCSD